MNNAIILFPAKLFNLTYSSVLLRFKSIKQTKKYICIQFCNPIAIYILLIFCNLRILTIFSQKKIEFFSEKIW